MIKSILYILAVSILIACNSNTIIKKPDNLLPKDKMVSILAESYIAKSAKTVLNVHNERNINYLAFIYTNQGIDSVTFNESLKYYTSDISLNEEILKLVQQSLDKKLEDLKTERDTLFSTRVDSLKQSRLKILDEELLVLKENQDKKLSKKIDSIKKSKDDLFSKQIENIKKSLKDTLKLRSETSINVFKDSIHQQIDAVTEIKTDSINSSIEKIKSLHQKLVDEKIETLKEKSEDYISKKTREFERQKYR